MNNWSTERFIVTTNAQNTLQHFQEGALAPSSPCPCLRAPTLKAELLLAAIEDLIRQLNTTHGTWHQFCERKERSYTVWERVADADTIRLF